MILKGQGCFLVLCTLQLLLSRPAAGREDEEEEDPYTTTDPAKREPSPCEVCKNFMTELMERLHKSGKSKEIIRTGHGLDKKKSTVYHTSELRLIEALHEPHICENIREYNVHAERQGSARHAKGPSQTFETLKGLVNKGVEVKTDVPYDLWDQPGAEIIKMERACYTLAERMEEDIEEWYFQHQDQNIMNYICRDRVLKGSDSNCLDEKWEPKGDTDDDNHSDQPKRKSRGSKTKKHKKNEL